MIDVNHPLAILGNRFSQWTDCGIIVFSSVRFIAVVGIWMWVRKAVNFYLVLAVLTATLWFAFDRLALSILSVIEIILLGLVVPSRWSKMT